jgi:hypothetical protein
MTGIVHAFRPGKTFANLVISSNVKNYNVMTAVTSALGYTPTGPVDVRLTVNSGVIVGSTSPGTVNSTVQDIVLLTRNYALDASSLPVGSTLYLINNGYIVGAGGQGGGDGTESNFAEGFPGGDAIRVSGYTALENYGIIGGGGGGGAGGDGNGNNRPTGGGGAGDTPGPAGVGGAGGSTPQPGTLLTGGIGRFGATGGNLGQPGTDYGIGRGGPAGYAITGVSNVSYIVLGDIRGPTI